MFILLLPFSLIFELFINEEEITPIERGFDVLKPKLDKLLIS